MKKIAYLCSEYPAISHTFIFREIQSMRAEGLDIYPVSVDRTRNLARMTAAEQQEARQTLILKETSLLTGLIALLAVFGRQPLGLLRMTVQAIVLCFKGPKKPLKALGYLAEAIILVAWLQKNQIEHIHEHFANPTAVVALLVKSCSGISYSLSVHGPDIFYQVDSSLLGQKISEASFVRCISHYCRSQLWRISPHASWGKFHIVRCGVDPEVYRPSLQTTHTVPELLCVGRLCPAKGQHVLLGACALLKQQLIPFHLTLVGDGEDRQSLETMVRQSNLSTQVTFTGALGQDEVRGFYDSADIFVLPSFAEGVPVVLMEAMAKEIPVVTTRITGIPELVEDQHQGLLATPGDVEELAQQLRLLLADKPLATALGAAGRAQVVLRYNQHQNNPRLAALFAEYGEQPC